MATSALMLAAAHAVALLGQLPAPEQLLRGHGAPAQSEHLVGYPRRNLSI